MHIPRISRPHVRGAFSRLKNVCVNKEKAAKKTIPGMLLIAQSLAIPVNAPVAAKMAKTKSSEIIDVFEHTPAAFHSVKNMIQKVVPDVSDEFVYQIVETSEKVKCSPEDLTALLYKESGFKPNVKNGSFGGIGQMNGTSLNLSIQHAEKDKNAKKGIQNLMIEKFLSLPREEQMPYVRNYILAMKSLYIRNMDKPLSGGELYGLFYTPGRINKKYLTSAKDSATARMYKQNKQLDFDRDSVITKQDLQSVLDRIKFTDLNIHLAKK